MSPSPSATTSNTGVIGGERHVLHQPGDAQAGLRPDDAAVRRLIAADDLQQRRLARAVAADQADALARLDLQRHVVEQGQVTEGDRDMIEGDEGHEPRPPEPPSFRRPPGDPGRRTRRRCPGLGLGIPRRPCCLLFSSLIASMWAPMNHWSPKESFTRRTGRHRTDRPFLQRCCSRTPVLRCRRRRCFRRRCTLRRTWPATARWRCPSLRGNRRTAPRRARCGPCLLLDACVSFVLKTCVTN